MTPPSPYLTPDEVVASLIVERLEKEELLPPQHIQGLKTQLLNGKMKADDWRRVAERAIDEQFREAQNE